jgi:hypothetical protein
MFQFTESLPIAAPPGEGWATFVDIEAHWLTIHRSVRTTASKGWWHVNRKYYLQHQGKDVPVICACRAEKPDD